MPAAAKHEYNERPPRCSSVRERQLLRRMCERAGVDFTEWECARLLTEFKRKLTRRQWIWLREHAPIETPEDALRSLILIGFENRRLERLRLRGRGRDRVWAEAGQQARMRTLFASNGRGLREGNRRPKRRRPKRPAGRFKRR